MKLKRLGGFALSLLSLTMTAHANEVLFTAKQPMKIVFRIAHSNHGSQPVFSEPQSMNINGNTLIHPNTALQQLL